MIRMMVTDMLEELGHQIIAEAGNVDDAERLVQTVDFDLAILDVNLNGRPISPVADLVRLKGRPFIFATGYGVAGLPEGHRHQPTLQKPFQISALDDSIEALFREPLSAPPAP